MSLLNSDINQGTTAKYLDFMSGMDVDAKLALAEIRVQDAWVQALGHAGVLTATEADTAHSMLAELKRQFEEPEKKRFWDQEDEDIHLAIERVFTEKHGDLGRKLHTGRSRNDLIATTLRIFLADQCRLLAGSLNQLVSTLTDLSIRDLDIIVPAQTHRQAAQPVRMAHLWNAHALQFVSDFQRMHAARNEALAVCPLGSAAVAGTHLPVDLQGVAERLGFSSAPRNSVHSTSDRDFAITFGHGMAFVGLHLTRLCEDIIYWSSTPLSLVQLPTSWSSGSSIMPNKRNPDFFEVLRAKGKRLISLSRELTDLSIGLPMGYASDFHEQKRVLVLLGEVGIQSLDSLAPAISEAQVMNGRARELLGQGHLLATDFANQLVSQGVPFRTAYKKAASEVARATAAGQQLSMKDFDWVDSVESRNQSGGTSRARVIETVESLKQALQVNE